MQEQAPANQRGRVMSFHSLSFMGAGPVGALLCGYLVELLSDMPLVEREALQLPD